MTLLPLLLVLAAAPPPQTSTAIFMVRAQVVQTCVLSPSGARCTGARDRPAGRRVIRGGAVTTFEF